jgi:hypothetical protein
MIKTENIKIPNKKDFDNIFIENELKKSFSSIIRWSIVNIDKDLTINVSYYQG